MLIQHRCCLGQTDENIPWRRSLANHDGVEFLLELENSNHQRKKSGSMTNGDIITFPVEAAVDSTVVIFLYSGNPRAWLPPDIRDFTDDIECSERAINEWLRLKEGFPLYTTEISVQSKTPEKRELSMSLQIYPGYLY